MGKYVVFISIGFELVGLVLGSYYLGQILDESYHSDGMIFVGLMISSLIGWLVRVVLLLKKIEKEDEK